MQQNNTVSFFAPGFDDTIEQQKLDRQRKLADALRLQSAEPVKGQMVGSVFVPPSWTNGLASVLKAYQSGSMERDADTKQTALAQAMQSRNQQEAKDFFSTLRGTPATSTPNPIADDEGNAMPPSTTAAVPGNQDKAIEMAFNAKSPLVQSYGGQLATGQLQQQQMMDKLAAALKMANGGAPAPAAISPSGAPAAPSVPNQPGPAGGGAPTAGAPTSIGGVNPLAFALTMTGDPALGKVGGMVADANKPLINRGYGLNKLNPATGNYELDPGSLQGIKDVENAKADIAAKNDMIRVDTGNGQYTYVPRSQIAGQQSPPAAPRSMPAPPQGPPGSPQLVNQGPGTLTPQLQAAILSDAAQNGGPPPTAKFVAPGMSNPVFGFQPTPQGTAQIPPQTPPIAPQAAPLAPAPISAQVPPVAPQSAPVPPQGSSASQPTGVPPGAPVYGQSTADVHLQGERGKMLAEQEAKINADAESALAKLAQNNKMVDLIPSITTGPGAKALTTVRTLAQNLGVDIGDPAPNQEFEKYAIKGALEGAKQIYGSRLTNQDVMSQIASNPGTTMADKALYQLINYDNIVQQRHLDKQQQYFNYTGPKEQFGMWFNQNNPYMGLTAPSGGQSAATTAPGRPTPAIPSPVKQSRLKQNADGSFTYMAP